MDKLRELFKGEKCRGALCSEKGEYFLFQNHGVTDLMHLLDNAPNILYNAKIVDSVVGRGAAFLMIKGGIKELHAEILSESAYNLFQKTNIQVTYSQLVPFILNRKGNDYCPIERITEKAHNEEEAYLLIKQFIENKKQQK